MVAPVDAFAVDLAPLTNSLVSLSIKAGILDDLALLGKKSRSNGKSVFLLLKAVALTISSPS